MQAPRARFGSYLLSAFVSDFVYIVFYTFLPLLAYQLGATIFEIGLVGGTSYAVYSFMPFVLGRFSNKLFVRSLFIVSSFALLALVSLVYSTTNSPVVIVLARVVEGVSWTLVWPALQAGFALDTIMSPKKALNYYNITWSAGATLGPLIGAELVSLYSFRITFVLMTIILILTAAVNAISFFFPASPKKVSSADGVSQISTMNSISMEEEQQQDAMKKIDESPAATERLQEKSILVNTAFYLAAIVALTMATTIILTFFPPYASSIGISVLFIGAMPFAFAIARFVVYYLNSHERVASLLFSSSRKRNLKLLSGLGFLALASAAFLLGRGNIVVYLIAAASAGALYAVIAGMTQIALIAEAPPAKAGTASGTYETAVGIGSTAGPIVAGLVSGGSLLRAFYVPVVGVLGVVIIFVIALSTEKSA